MARTLGSKNTRNLTTLSRFDQYVEQYGDPMELLFSAMNGKIHGVKKKLDNATRLQAAKELMAYGYSKKALIKHQVDTGDGQLMIQWQDDLFEDENAAISDHSIQTESPAITITQASDPV